MSENEEGVALESAEDNTEDDTVPEVINQKTPLSLPLPGWGGENKKTLALYFNPSPLFLNKCLNQLFFIKQSRINIRLQVNNSPFLTFVLTPNDS